MGLGGQGSAAAGSRALGVLMLVTHPRGCDESAHCNIVGSS